MKEGTVRKLLLAAVPVLVLAGCTTLSDSDRALLNEAKMSADQAKQAAEAAQVAAERAQQDAAASAAAAQQAAAQSQAAASKADAIYMQMQRK